MNTQRVATELRLTQWAQMIQGRMESGQSIKEFCHAMGVSKNTYFYWQRRLRAAAFEAFPNKTSELIVKLQNEPVKANRSVVPSGWAICETAENKDSVKALPIEINGCRVLADTDFDSELLAKVCKVLLALGC